MCHTDIQFVHIKSDKYPSKLKELYDSPACLYVRGKLPSETKASVAIIGARNCTEYGRSVAGYTCAVLGCGVDICYPSQNIELFTNIINNGCVLSEYPLGTRPISANFPVRNRIISGLADVVIVVEAKKKSGSLITVDLALEQNKEVMAVPGRIGDILSEGCNELIKQGAMVITNPEDIRLSSFITKWIKDSEMGKTNILQKMSMKR